MTKIETDVVILGAGVTGLSTACSLLKKNKSSLILDCAHQIGGAVRSSFQNGFLCEAGPNSMLVKSPRVWDFLDEMGLGKKIIEANPLAKKRYLVKNNRLVPLPASPLQAVQTPLYTFPQKLRVLGEPFAKSSDQEDESVTSFVSRRLGPAFLEYGISALVSGIYAGDPDVLSIRHAFPKVWNLERNYGSLIKGALRIKKERKQSGIKAFPSRMISFPDGLTELPQTLAKRSSINCMLNCRFEEIWRDEAGTWRGVFVSNNEKFSFACRDLILTIPSYRLASLPFQPELKEQITGLPKLIYPPLSTVVLGFSREQISHPLDGFGALFPRLEKRFCLGTIFSSSLFPNRAPEGHVSLMCFIGGVQQPNIANLPTAEMVPEVLRDLSPLLGISGEPVFQSHSFWPMAIPQYNVGHQIFLDKLDALERNFPNLHLQGNYRGGPGLNDCIESAISLAERI